MTSSGRSYNSTFRRAWDFPPETPDHNPSSLFCSNNKHLKSAYLPTEMTPAFDPQLSTTKGDVRLSKSFTRRQYHSDSKWELNSKGMKRKMTKSESRFHVPPFWKDLNWSMKSNPCFWFTLSSADIFTNEIWQINPKPLLTSRSCAEIILNEKAW